MRLYENTPANDFADAHLLGNGSLGASVYGGAPYETVLLNHDTLWSGQEAAKTSPSTLAHFAKARELVLNGRVKEATELINNRMLGYWSEAYMPLGHLHLTFGHVTDQRLLWQREALAAPYEDYARVLDLETAVETITYRQHGRACTREMFVSYPDGVLAVKLRAEGGSLDFSLAMDSPLRHEQTVGENGVGVIGRAPDRVECYPPSSFRPEIVYKPDADTDALRFAAAARVVDTDGTLSTDGWRCYVSGASYAVILVSAGTDYAGFQKKRGKDALLVQNACASVIGQAAAKGYDALLAAHVGDYRRYYDRVSIDLGDEVTGSLPTSERIARMRNIDDPSIAALILQYNRYLLLAFSRPGSQAGNLQGIWNPSAQPPWSSNYTTNINVQMNYWGAHSLNLTECALPLTDLVLECARSGERSARELYGLPGWVVHHNTDLWRFSALCGEDASWSWWAFGGFWMCAHLWEHYAFTLDKEYLRAVYPVLRGAAEFLAAYVVKDADGLYVTAPSTSPENKFFINGSTVKTALSEVSASNRMSPSRADTAEVCKASTMDLAIIRELFGNLKRAAEILGERDALLEKTDAILAALRPFAVGKTGALQEWDEDYEECTPGMAHVSHLYTVYPSEVIDRRQPELFEAARLALLRRRQHDGGVERHWPGAWKLCLFARFGDGAQCGLIHAMMNEDFGANLLLKRVWQIDAIMGWGAGIVEMLLQSHGGEIRFLPALVPSWRSGRVEGLMARGGVTVGMRWRDGALVSATLHSPRDRDVRVCCGSHSALVSLPAGKTVMLDNILREMVE